jgi:hypothetical protein
MVSAIFLDVANQPDLISRELRRQPDGSANTYSPESKKALVGYCHCLLSPLLIWFALAAADESALIRAGALVMGLAFLFFAWRSLQEVLGARPIIRIDDAGVHLNETAISFYLRWNEISGVSRQKMVGADYDAVYLQLTTENYEAFCARLPSWAQGLFRAHGRWPWLSKALLGLSVIKLDIPDLGDIVDAAEVLSERTPPRYAVGLPLVHLQTSAEELEEILLRILAAR